MQTLRKKNSPCKFKNEPTRFLGEGVSFKAKLIGILEVSEARGDRMCQAALSDLKIAIRAAGEHKQRIAVQDCLYHHPVHKISFIAQDMSDSRAFGYIFGSPDTGHRFFGIKTDKAASQVVIAMRDLFQVVFELKKKEIELAKQHIAQSAIKFHSSGIFVEPAPDTKGAEGSETSLHRTRALNSEVEKPIERKQESQSGVIADLLDLQFELNSLQQGIHQMDKITPDNSKPSSEDPFETDPFGDSFANMKVKDSFQPILPPPPASAKRGHLERQQTVPASSASTSSSPALTLASKTPPPQGPVHWFDKETENLFNEGELANLIKTSSVEKEKDNGSSSTTPNLRKSPQIDVFTELDPLGTGLIKPYVDKKDFFQHLKNPPKKVLKDLVGTCSEDTFPANFNISTEPIEPVKIHGKALSKSIEGPEGNNFADFDKFDESEGRASKPNSPRPKKDSGRRTIHHQPLSVSLPPEEIAVPKGVPVTYAIPNTAATISVMNKMEKESTEPIQALVRLRSPKKYLQSVRKRDFDAEVAGSRTQSLDKPFPVDFSATGDSPASPMRSCSSDANSRLSSSSAELEIVPEPPPRGAGNILINPPPLPPKKQGGRNVIKPPPRPPHTEGHFHYDFLEREEASPSPTRREVHRYAARDLKNVFDDDFSPSPPQLPRRSEVVVAFPTSKFEDSFGSVTPSTLSSLLQNTHSSTTSSEASKKAKPSLDITLSQLTSSNLADLAADLGMSVEELTSLTLQQLTECLATLSAREAESRAEEATSSKPPRQTSVPTKTQTSTKVVETSFVSNEPLFKANFAQDAKRQESDGYDKYAVFRELLEMEQMKERAKDEAAEEVPVEVTVGVETKVEEEQTVTSENPEIRADVTGDVLSERSTKSPARSSPMTIVSSKSESRFEMEKADADSVTVTRQEARFEEYVVRTRDYEEIVRSASKESERNGEDTAKSSEKSDEEMDVREARPEKRTSEPEESGGPEKSESSSRRSEEPQQESIGETIESKVSPSTTGDRYAALRQMIEETKQVGAVASKTKEEDPVDSSPPDYPASKTSADIDLMSLFSEPLPTSAVAKSKEPSPPSARSSAKREEDSKAAAVDIFEEIKMLSSRAQRFSAEKKSSLLGFEDVFSPFPDSTDEKEAGKDDGNWARFDANVFHSDKSSGEGAGSVGGTSPWSPDGKEFLKEPSFKTDVRRASGGDSDNEWKDEEESEESNGRARDDGFWSGKPPVFESGSFEERGYYEETGAPGAEKERSFRERSAKGTRGAPWAKGGSHRSRDPSPWYEDGRWEEGHRRYTHRKVPYKDEEEYKAYWKCRPKQRPWNGEREGYWSHDHPSYEEERSKRRMMLWSEEDRDRDRFSSQESMGYEDEERWSRREYERRRWDEDGRFWGRRVPENDYTYREPYRKHESHYMRDRPHDYPLGWEEEYGPEHAEDSPRYLSSRRRHWPKRPNSAIEGRNTEVIYADPRLKYGVSRSECSDNDSDPYHRPHRSRSRERYWGSDQEYDSWAERPYWSEGPDTKTETLHRRRMNRHRPRPQTKSQSSPFEDDFAQSAERGEESPDPFVTEPRVPSDAELKQPEGSSPSPRSSKEPPPRKDPKLYKHSGYFEDDLTPTVSVSSDTSDRQRLGGDLKVTPEELPGDAKDPPSADGFVSEDSGRDSFFNGDPRFDDDAFVFKSELEDNVSDRATTLPLKNSRQMKCGSGKMKGDQYIKKSESVNIFARESDPFDDDDFFN